MAVTGFTAEQKAIVLFRDFERCCVCGNKATEVNHRGNRGMGGFLAANSLVNACAICTRCNGLIEDGPLAAVARACGAKISKYYQTGDPADLQLFHPFYKMWVDLLENGDYTFADVQRPNPFTLPPV